MALKSSYSKTDLPKGAILVSEKEALNYQKNFIENWPSQSEVFGLKFGSTIVGTITAASSAFIANHFRLLFRADLKIIAVTFIPGLAVPYYFSQSCTDQNVTNKILLMKVQCPLCLNAKFALQQFYSSLLFPSLYTFTSYAMYADLRGTYAFPNFQRDALRFWKESFKAFKTGARTFQIVGLVQTVIIFFLPYWQQKELSNILNKSEENKDSELLLS